MIVFVLTMILANGNLVYGNNAIYAHKHDCEVALESLRAADPDGHVSNHAACIEVEVRQ